MLFRSPVHFKSPTWPPAPAHPMSSPPTRGYDSTFDFLPFKPLNHYKKQNADLKWAGVLTDTQFMTHYLNYGARAGLRAHPIFSTQNYLSKNSDLSKIATLPEGINYCFGTSHFVTYGEKQERPF